jgi:uncharacterized protein (TIGR02001 family)
MKGTIMIKKTVIAGLVTAALGSGLAQAQAPAAPASPHTFTGNVGLYSQYIFRGLTQTNGDPALQGGFDYSHSSGFYAGVWGSNISWLRDGVTATGAGAPAYSSGGNLELDFYGGYKWSFPNDLTLDLGTLYYWYPGEPNNVAANNGNALNPKADTWEIYGALSWKWLSAKLSFSVDDKTFGVLDSSGTYYLDLTATYPIPNTPVSIIAHYGMQKFTGQDPRLVGIASNDSACSYDDWKLGLNYTLPKDFTIGVFYTDTTSANSLCYGTPFETPAGSYPKNISKGTGTVFISKTF